MKCYRISKKVKKEYSWVYINIPSKIQDLLLDFGKEIDPDDLYKKEADDGIETEPHITVKYALKTDDVKDIKEVLDNKKGGKFYLGESSIFETDKYDVVKIEVKSEDLKEIHEDLNKLPHEDKYPEYQAHATIAYLKKGRGKKYEGKFKINKYFKFDELFFGDIERKDHKIILNDNTKFNGYKLAQEENDLNEKEERVDENMEKLKKMISKNYNWYKTALIVEKGDSGKVAYPVCAWCGKFGTTPSGKEETGKYMWKEVSELNPEEKKQYDKFKWAYDLMKAGKLNLNDPIGFTHGICPSCAQQAY